MTATAELVKAHQEGLAYLRGTRDSLEQKLAVAKAELSTAQDELRGLLPVTPNLLVDTYQFSSLSGGAVNTEKTAQEAHAGSIFSAYFSYGGSVADTKMTVLTLDKLKDYGLHPVVGDDFQKKVNGNFDHPTLPFSGANFRVVLFDINLTTAGSGVGYLHQALAGQTTGWGMGSEATLYASAMVNVLECTPGLKYAVHANATGEQCVISDADIGKGWQHKYGTRKRLGGLYQPWSRGTNLGRIRFAMCLPYIGFGDHGGNFIWVDSVGTASQYAARTMNPAYSHFHGN
jgi:hypothetical protein